MKKHVKIYLDYFGYSGFEFIECEVCGGKAVEIHHIYPRGMGGSAKRDVIENLMAVCRMCHILRGDLKHEREFLINKHNDKIRKRV